jgi:uncharacterized Zn finger protein
MLRDPDSIRYARDELAREVHISNELIAASTARSGLLTLADDIENDPSAMLWFKGWDKADVVAQLREWASVSDAAVERAARDAFVGEEG